MATGRGEVPAISVGEANERLTTPDSDALLLDVRETYEYVPRRARGAVSIPMSQIQRRIAEVPRDREVLVICEHGSRSANVVKYLRSLGIERAINVAGGTDAWQRSGLPMEHGAPPRQ